MAAVPVILDTDMDFDVDDVGALCVLHALQVWEDLIIMGVDTIREKPGLCFSDSESSRTLT